MRLCDDDVEAASLICHSTCQMPALRRTVRTAFSVIITPFFVLIPLSLTSSRIRRFVLWSRHPVFFPLRGDEVSESFVDCAVVGIRRELSSATKSNFCSREEAYLRARRDWAPASSWMGIALDWVYLYTRWFYTRWFYTRWIDVGKGYYGPYGTQLFESDEVLLWFRLRDRK